MPINKSKTILQNNEQTHADKNRFRSPVDLWNRYNDVKAKSEPAHAERKKIIQMYERYPYKKTIQGKTRSEPNWGKYRVAIDEYIKFFSSIALDREIWCRVETYHGLEEDKDCYYSDQITAAFHKFCVKPWHDREAEVIKCISDDCFFNRGSMYWNNPIDTYPRHIPSECVFPDTNATTNPDSFDILFIREKLTATELFTLATTSKDLGWNEGAILLALKNSLDSLKQCETKDIIETWRRGAIDQIDQDRQIPIVYCYVKEYSNSKIKGRSKNQISLMVIPESILAMGIDDQNSVTEKQKKELAASKNRMDYLCYSDFYAKDFRAVLSMWTSNIEKGFYSTESFAKQIYLGCKFYDQTMNSIIRAIKRSMRLYLKSSSAETKKKMSSMDADTEVVPLGPDDSIEQVNIKQDVGAASELLRSVSASVSSFSPNDFQGTQSSPKGYPITKGEAQILAQQLDDSKSTSIKLFISSNRKFVAELYRRFVQGDGSAETYENYVRFKKYLEMRDVPEEAWKENSVEIYPRFNQFAGKASNNYATAKGLLEATQIKPASKAEEKAKRDVIASLVGESNVYDYMDIAPQLEQEMMIIGQENESLDNPYANPANIPVTATDNHFLHIQGHLQDYMFKLQAASQLLNSAASQAGLAKAFVIERAADIINAQDNKGAHLTAHLQVAATDDSKQDELKSLNQQFSQAQAAQDQLANAVKKAQEQMAVDQQAMTAQDQELAHRQRMSDLEFSHAKAMNNVGLEKAGMQTAARQEATKQNQAIKVEGKMKDMETKQQDKSIDLAAKQQSAQIDLEKKRIEKDMKKSEANDKAAKKKTGNTQS